MNVTGISVSFKGTIPTQAYGNIALDVTWQAELGPADSPEQCTQDLFARIRSEVIKAVEPIAKARVKGMESALSGLPQSEREKIMLAGGVFNFLNTVAPELAFAEKPEVTIADLNSAVSKLADLQESVMGALADLNLEAAIETDPIRRKIMLDLVSMFERVIDNELKDLPKTK